MFQSEQGSAMMQTFVTVVFFMKGCNRCGTDINTKVNKGCSCRKPLCNGAGCRMHRGRYSFF